VILYAEVLRIALDNKNLNSPNHPPIVSRGICKGIIINRTIISYLQSNAYAIYSIPALGTNK